MGTPAASSGGNRERKLRREHRQPADVLLHLPDRPVDARQAHDPVGTEAEEGVVGSPGQERLDRETGPLGELLLDQPGDECRVDLASSSCILPRAGHRASQTRVGGAPGRSVEPLRAWRTAP